MSPEQRTLCDLLQKLHTDFCEQHNIYGRRPPPVRTVPALPDDPTIETFDLDKFQEALVVLFGAGQALDRALKAKPTQ